MYASSVLRENFFAGGGVVTLSCVFKAAVTFATPGSFLGDFTFFGGEAADGLTLRGMLSSMALFSSSLSLLLLASSSSLLSLLLSLSVVGGIGGSCARDGLRICGRVGVVPPGRGRGRIGPRGTRRRHRRGPGSIGTRRVDGGGRQVRPVRLLDIDYRRLPVGGRQSQPRQ